MLPRCSTAFIGGRCCVCFARSIIGARCEGRHHFTCKDCFDQLVHYASIAEADELHARKARVFCPCSAPAAGGCDAPAFSDRTIAKLATMDTHREYQAARARVEAAESVLAKCKPKQAITEKQLRALFPGARQCPACGFGPVTARGCDDMSAHHGQRSGPGRTAISNACPRCNHFVTHYSRWRTWDGRMHNQQGLRGAVAGILRLFARRWTRMKSIICVLLLLGMYARPFISEALASQGMGSTRTLWANLVSFMNRVRTWVWERWF